MDFTVFVNLAEIQKIRPKNLNFGVLTITTYKGGFLCLKFIIAKNVIAQ